jgi:hypothetical protein
MLYLAILKYTDFLLYIGMECGLPTGAGYRINICGIRFKTIEMNRD